MHRSNVDPLVPDSFRMGVGIRLLGPPQIVVGGEPRRLKGRKSWGLLANVLLEPNTTCPNLVDRLFADAEDRWPLGAGTCCSCAERP